MKGPEVAHDSSIDEDSPNQREKGCNRGNEVGVVENPWNSKSRHDKKGCHKVCRFASCSSAYIESAILASEIPLRKDQSSRSRNKKTHSFSSPQSPDDLAESLFVMAFGSGARRYVRTTKRGSQFPKRAQERTTEMMPDARRKARQRIVVIPPVILYNSRTF